MTDEDASGAIDMGIHCISSHVGDDGSAEAVLCPSFKFAKVEPVPMTRSVSTPLGSSIHMSRTKSSQRGVSYAMRRVLSRDDRGLHAVAGVSEQEAEGLVTHTNSNISSISSRIGTHTEGGLEIELDEPCTSPLTLVKTKSGLCLGNISYSVRKVFSKEDNEWQAALQNREVEGLVSHQESVSRVISRVEADEEGAEAILDSEQCDDNLTSEYRLRQVKSTPLKGMEEGYPLKSIKTSHDDGSLLRNNPVSFVRSRFSSLGKKGGKGKGSKDDDGTTTAETIDTSSTVSDYDPNMKKKRKFFSNKTIIAFVMLLSLIVASGGVIYVMKPNLINKILGSFDKNGHAETIAAANMAVFNNPFSEPSSQPSNSSTAIASIQPTTTHRPSQASTTSKPVSEGTVEAPVLHAHAPSTEPSSPTQNVTTITSIQPITLRPSQGSTTSNLVSEGPLEALVLHTHVPSTEPSSPTQNMTSMASTQPTTLRPSQGSTTSKPISEAPVDAPVPPTQTQSSSLTSTVTTINSVNYTLTMPPQTTENVISSLTTRPSESISETLIEEIEKTAEDTITTFYVMADAPYTDNERYNLMPKHIEGLGDDGEFLVHLGDLQYAEVDQCREGAYYEAKEILKKSRMPTFVIPGDNDINDCYTLSHGEEMWMEYFTRFDERWDHRFDVTRWGELDESFAFIHKEVLYFGINIVGGTPYSNSEKKRRHQEHLERISTIMNDRSEYFKVVVLFGHAEPSSHHEDFFKGNGGFISLIYEMGKPTIHFHGDLHKYYEKESEYGVRNYVRISLDGESVAPPISVTIDVSKESPITVSRRESGLKVKCCSNGWPQQ